MDQATLVKERVTGGDKLLTKLRDRGFEVVAACWAKTDDDGQWYLYIVSPRVDTDGRSAAYDAILGALAAMDNEWADPFERVGPLDVKVLRPSQPLGQAVLEQYHRFPDSSPTWHRGSVLGSVSIDGAYIYPPTMFTQPQPTP
jgi:hypothetical protein